MIGNTNYTCSAYSKLFLNSRSSRNLKAADKTNQSNISNDQRSKSKRQAKKSSDKTNLIALITKISNKNSNRHKDN